MARLDSRLINSHILSPSHHIMDKVAVFFALSSEITTNVKVKILAVEGKFSKLYPQSAKISNPSLSKQLSKTRYNSDLFITVQIFSGNIPLSLPVQTKYASFDKDTSGAAENSYPLSKLYSSSAGYRRLYNQWINLPVSFSQLPLDTRFEFKIYEFVGCEKTLFGSCSLSAFDIKDGSLIKGHQCMRITLNSERFGLFEPDTEYEKSISQLQGLMKRLESLDSEKTENDEWMLQKITSKIEKLNRKIISEYPDRFNLYVELMNFDLNVIYDDHIYTSKNYLQSNKQKIANKDLAAMSNSNSLTNSGVSEARTPRTKPQTNVATNPGALINIDSVNGNDKYSTTQIFDPEQENNQPIELKYRQLERSSLSNTNYKKLTDQNLKPNLKSKKELNAILKYSSIKTLNSNERNLIYKFRYYLINNFKLNSSSLDGSNFLNFLLKSINWENNNEIIETREILNNLIINKLKISLTNTLELLGPIFDRNILVRNFAVNNLKYFDDDDINLYLLQLVQALKFDDYAYSTALITNSTTSATSGSKEEILNQFKSLKYNKYSGPNEISFTKDDDLLDSSLSQSLVDENLSPLANFLILKSIRNKKLGNYFYWYTKIESKDIENDFKIQLVFKKILKVFLKNLKSESNLKSEREEIVESGSREERGDNNSVEEILADDDIVPAVNTEQEDNQGIYKTFKSNINKVLDKTKGTSSSTATGNELDYANLQEQVTFIKKISNLTKQMGSMKKTTPEKQQILKSILSKNESNYKYFDPNNTTALALPLNPDIEILHVIPEQCTVFKSSLAPLKLTFKVADSSPIKSGNGTYSFMYKVGDDLRQDQLIIQIIKLIEKLLKDENLNLKLNPYQILATDLNEGMIEFVPNLTLDKVLNKYQNILTFFKEENPYGEFIGKSPSPDNISSEVFKDVMSKNNLEQSIAEAINTNNTDNDLDIKGVHPKIMDNFVKSCAGYCVITYLLGIGDRHLDNLLICKNGKFFHVDFGYILGKDPKPFPPLMKLPIEIIDGFGGLNSKFFQDFKNYCYVCFLTLRKNSNLILNLLELMTFGNIPDLKVDGRGSILKVQDKFMLGLNDEEAIVYFQNLIHDSVNAFLPVVIDKLHSLAQYWRA